MKAGRETPAGSGYRTLAVLGLCLLPALARPDPGNPLTGDYRGTATVTSPARIGAVDLAFHLDVTGSAFGKADSYIDAGKTLLFSEVPPQIDGKAVGARVSGTASAAKFSLDSQAFPDRALDRDVTRSLRLRSTSVKDGGTTIAGTYAETVVGYGGVPIVIKGTFQLRKLVPAVAAQ